MIMDERLQVTRFRIPNGHGFSLRGAVPDILRAFCLRVYAQTLSPACGHRRKSSAQRKNQPNSVDRAKRLFDLSEVNLAIVRRELAGRPRVTESITATLQLRTT